METGLIITGLIVFLLNLISNCLGTLKTIFISKQLGKITYWLVAVDSLLFAVVLKAISSGDSFVTIAAFVAGKVFGAMLADYIEGKLALGLLEVTVFAKEEKAITIADSLRDMGYSVTTFKGYGMEGKERFTINITIARKEMSLLKEILSKYNLNTPNMVIKEVKSIQGNINPYAEKNTLL